MAENNFDGVVESLFKGMDSFITTKTVVGDAIHIGDTIILPLIDVSFGVGAGAIGSGETKNGSSAKGATSKNHAGGAMGGKITPSAVLVIQNGNIKLVNVKNQDSMTKIIDMVPDILDKFKAKNKEDEIFVENPEEEKSEEE